MVKKVLLCLACAIFAGSAGRCFAETMSLSLVKQKVNDAVRMLAAEGKQGFAKIKDPDGEFRFADGQGYIWIHDLHGKMIVHPTQPHLEGTPTIDMQDSRGFKFIAAMNILVAEAGEGWAAYMWPKPGRHDEAYKVAFVKKTMIDGTAYVIGCGMYDVGVADIKQRYPNDPITKY